MTTTLVRPDATDHDTRECTHDAPRHPAPQRHTPPRWVGWRRTIPAVGFAGVCAAAALTELSADEGTVLCPFRLLTGGWCPGCGCTRALKALVRGNISDSLAMNPWTAVLFVQAFVVSIGMLLVPTRTVTWLKRHQLIIGSLNVLVALAFWAYRLSTGVIPLPFT